MKNSNLTQHAAEHASIDRQHGRRRFLRRLASGLFVVGGGLALAGRNLTGAALAEELVRTPWQTEGPFYPDHLPLDTDNDLLIINDRITPAVGKITHLRGRILDARGNPVKGATIEIWQVDNGGSYIHSRDNHQRQDKNFQGYGRFETGSTGEYRFRTVKPVSYPGRTPHIHVKIRQGDRELLTTQCYVQGEPQNERDGILAGIRNARQRASVIVPFTPIAGSRAGELVARFDIVLGWTPPA
jgi:protocatechuate 3,4-dioxygenase beta subunit